jgi:hypothetical protein
VTLCVTLRHDRDPSSHGKNINTILGEYSR